VRVQSIHIYPVKGCYRTDLSEASVEPWGLRGDRRFMIVDEDDVMLTQRECQAMVKVKPAWDGSRLTLRAAGYDDQVVTPGEPGTDLVHTAVFSTPVAISRVDPAADGWLTEVLGRKVSLLWQGDATVRRVEAFPDDAVNLADVYPILLGNTASVGQLNDWLLAGRSLEFPIPIERFRPNVVISGATPWAEDGMTGGRVAIGDLTFRAPSQAGRCVVTTTDQDTGVKGHEPLRTLARHRTVDQQIRFGLNLIPEATGTIRIGDEVRAL
jgi:uncharacterized protein YcbX